MSPHLLTLPVKKKCKISFHYLSHQNNLFLRNLDRKYQNEIAKISYAKPSQKLKGLMALHFVPEHSGFFPIFSASQEEINGDNRQWNVLRVITISEYNLLKN